MILFHDTPYHFFVNGEDQVPVSYHLRAYGDPQRPAFVVTELSDNEGPSLASVTPDLVAEIAESADTIYKTPQNFPDLLWFEQTHPDAFQQVRFVAVQVDDEVVIQEAYRGDCPFEAVMAQLCVVAVPMPSASNDFDGSSNSDGNAPSR